MRILSFSGRGWADYTEWQDLDKKTLCKLNKLIGAIMRDPFKGIGKPESLKGLENVYGR